jgi:hypothetical protein
VADFDHHDAQIRPTALDAPEIDTMLQHLQQPLRTLLAATLLAPLAAAQVAVFQGQPGGVGSVFVIDPSGVAPATAISQLQGITLLPIECAGRTAINSFAQDRARFRDDVPQASRLELPAGKGSLYAYRRLANGLELYGYFVITASGQVRRLIESATSSPGLSPFVDRVAVAPDGGAILVATQSFAGGDLFEIQTANGLVTVRTAALPPQFFEGTGLALLANWGAAVGSNGLLRFERTAGAQVQPVAVSNATPVGVAREIVSTFNGMFCAALAEDESGFTYPIVLQRTGTARRVGNGVYPTAGVGQMPDAVHGPWLTVSEDGQWCAWRTTNGHYWGYEAWLAPVPWSTASSASTHVTQPALFDDYIDEIGDFFFDRHNRLTIAAGDRSANVNGLEKSDLYRITPSTGGGGLNIPGVAASTAAPLPQVENLTLTSGEQQAPFFYYGELVVERAFATPDGQSLYVVAKDDGARSMFALDADLPAPVVLEDEFTTLDYFDVAGGRMILSATYASEPDENGLAKVEAGQSTALEDVHEFGTTSQFRRGVSRPDGQTLYVLATPTGETLWRSNTQGLVVRMTPREFQLGPTMCFTPAGDAICTVQTTATPFYVVWTQSGAIRRVKGPAGPGFLLPAN